MAKPSDISIKIAVDNKDAEKALKSLGAALRRFQRTLIKQLEEERKLNQRKIADNNKEIASEIAKAQAKQKAARQAIAAKKLEIRQTEQIAKQNLLNFAKHAENRKQLVRARDQFIRMSTTQTEMEILKVTNTVNNRIIQSAKQTENLRLREKIAGTKKRINAEQELGRIERRLQKELAKSGILDFKLSENEKLKIKRQINSKNEALDKQAEAKRLSNKKKTEREILSAQKKANREQEAENRKSEAKKLADSRNKEIQKTKIFLDRIKHEIRLSEKGLQRSYILNQQKLNNVRLTEAQILDLFRRSSNKVRQFETAKANQILKTQRQLKAQREREHKSELAARLREERKAEALRIREEKKAANARIREEKKVTAAKAREEKKLTALKNKELAKQTRDAQKAAALQKSQVSGVYSSMGSAVQSLASTIDQYLIYSLQAATLSLAALSVQVLRVGAEFEQAVATLGAIRGQAGDALKPFEDQARLLGETTAFTATEAARGMQELARAGMQTGDIISSSNAALKFAGANATDMTTSTTLLASTMAQFGLSASQSTRVVDVFTTSLQNSLLNVQTLQVAMRYAGAVGASFGRSLEETTAMVALFRDLGLEGSTAGTQFRQAFLRLASPTKKAREVLERYGVSLSEINPKVNTFQEILQTLADSGIAQDLPAIKELVSIRAAGSFSKILSDVADGSSKLSSLLTAFEEGAGVTEKTYADMINTVSGQTAILKSVVEETFLRLFDVITQTGSNGENSPLMRLLKALQEVFKDINIAIDKFAQRYQKLIEQGGSDLLAYLEQNSAQIAAAFVNILDIIVKVILKLVELKDVFLEIGKALLAIRIAKGIFSGLTGALTGLNSALITMNLQFSAFGTRVAGAIAALTGPVGLIASITLATAAYIGLSVAASRFEETQRRIALGIEANKRSTKEYYEELDKLKVSTEDIKDVNTALITELINAEVPSQVIDSIEQELDAVSRLTDEQQREKLQKGEIIKVNTAFGETLLSNIALQKLTKTSIGDILYLEKERASALRVLTAQTDRYKKQFQELKEQQDAVKKTMGQGDIAAKSLSKRFEEIAIKLEEAETKYVLSKSRLDGLKRSIEEASKAEERSAAITQARIDLQDGMNSAQEESIELNEAEAESLDDLIAAMEARLELEKQIADTKMEQFGTTVEQTSKAENERIEEIEKIFRKEIKLREQHGKETTFLYQRLVDALAQDRANNNKEEIDELKSHLQSVLDERLNAIGKLKSALQQEVDVLKEGRRAFLEAENVSVDNQIQEQTENYAKQTQDLVAHLTNGQITQKQFNLRALELEKAHEAAIRKINKESDERLLENRKTFNKLIIALQVDTDKQIAASKKKFSEDLRKEDTKNIDSVDAFIEKMKEIKAEQKEVLLANRGESYLGENFRDDINFVAQKGINAQLEFAKSLLMTSQAGRRNERTIVDLTSEYIRQRNELNKYLDALDDGKLTFDDSRASLLKLALAYNFASNAASLLGSKLDSKLSGQVTNITRLFSDSARAILQFGAASADIKKVTTQIFKLQAVVEDFKDLGFKEFIKFRFDIIKDNFKDGSKALKDGFKRLANGFSEYRKDFRDTVAKEGLFKGIVFGAKFAIGKIVDLADLYKEKFRDFLVPASRLLFEIGKSAVRAAVEIAKISFDKIKDGLNFLTGGVNFNPFEIINDALSEFSELSGDAAEKQKELQDALASGSITQAEFDEANAALEQQKQQGGTPEQIQAFANNFISEISNRIKMIAQVAGPVLQAIAAEIPKLVDTFVSEIPKIVTSLTAALPDFFFAILDGLTAVFTSLTDQIKSTSGEAAGAFFTELSTKLVDFIGSLSSFITAAIQQIVANLPQIITGLTEIINGLISSIGEIAVSLISSLPDIMTGLLNSLTEIIANLGPILANIISATLKMLPDLLISIAEALPDLLGSIGTLLADVIVSLAGAVPKILTAVLNSLPQIISGLLEGIGNIVIALVEAAPAFIQGTIEALPDFIIAIITYLPRVVIELVALTIELLPKIAIALVKAIFIELPVALKDAAVKFARDFVNGIRKFFADAIERIRRALKIRKTDQEKKEAASKKLDQPSLFKQAMMEIVTQGMVVTETFGDTPHPIKAGTDGLTARFAKGDFIIAAQEPVELMRQSLMAMGGNLSSFVSNLSSSVPTPNITPPIMQGGGSSQVDIAVMADGRLLDAIQVRAMNNGNAPEMEKKFRRSSGATVGFNRGRFNKFGKR